MLDHLFGFVVGKPTLEVLRVEARREAAVFEVAEFTRSIHFGYQHLIEVVAECSFVIVSPGVLRGQGLSWEIGVRSRVIIGVRREVVKMENYRDSCDSLCGASWEAL